MTPPPSPPPPPRRKRLPLNTALLRLRRELNGTKFYVRPSSPKDLPRYHVDQLDPTLKMRQYLILGEQSTYPYHLITMSKFSEGAQPTFQGLPISYLDPDWIPPAGIAYWAFDPETLRLTLVHTTSHTAPPHSGHLHLAYTAWVNEISQPVQVLGWAQKLWSPRVPACFDDYGIVFEFRCAAQSVQLESVAALGAGPNVCFADVTSRSDSTVKLLHGGLLYLYEPNIGNVSALPDTPAWATLSPGRDMTVRYDHSDPSHPPVISPRVRILRLKTLAALFLGTCKSLPALGGRSPELRNFMSLFLPSKPVLRDIHDGLGMHGKTLIACGTVEKLSGFFHLLVFSLQLPSTDKHPRVAVVTAKAFGITPGFADEEDGTLTPENAAFLFNTALKKCGVARGIEHSVHNCEKGCTHHEISVKKAYVAGASTLKEIVCPELGIVLEGWSDQSGQRRRTYRVRGGGRALSALAEAAEAEAAAAAVLAGE